MVGVGGKVDKNSARVGRRPLEVRQDVSELKIASDSLWVGKVGECGVLENMWFGLRDPNGLQMEEWQTVSRPGDLVTWRPVCLFAVVLRLWRLCFCSLANTKTSSRWDRGGGGELIDRKSNTE